jgi:hypothetical protein
LTVEELVIVIKAQIKKQEDICCYGTTERDVYINGVLIGSRPLTGYDGLFDLYKLVEDILNAVQIPALPMVAESSNTPAETDKGA